MTPFEGAPCRFITSEPPDEAVQVGCDGALTHSHEGAAERDREQQRREL